MRTLEQAKGHGRVNDVTGFRPVSRICRACQNLAMEILPIVLVVGIAMFSAGVMVGLWWAEQLKD
ncbi:MAG: hypothetical protein JWP10_1529 [Nocardioidaceae bacterium]|nr:hypothetical protein [Nocardioidaceae bacterium]